MIRNFLLKLLLEVLTPTSPKIIEYVYQIALNFNEYKTDPILTIYYGPV